MHHADGSVTDHLQHCSTNVLPCMVAVRAAADGLEQLIDEAAWPLPTYQEMLFMR
jgi:glutamine synthetase